MCLMREEFLDNLFPCFFLHKKCIIFYLKFSSAIEENVQFYIHHKLVYSYAIASANLIMGFLSQPHSCTHSSVTSFMKIPFIAMGKFPKCLSKTFSTLLAIAANWLLVSFLVFIIKKVQKMRRCLFSSIYFLWV